MPRFSRVEPAIIGVILAPVFALVLCAMFDVWGIYHACGNWVDRAISRLLQWSGL